MNAIIFIVLIHLLFNRCEGFPTRSSSAWKRDRVHITLCGVNEGVKLWVRSVRENAPVRAGNPESFEWIRFSRSKEIDDFTHMYALEKNGALFFMQDARNDSIRLVPNDPPTDNISEDDPRLFHYQYNKQGMRRMLTNRADGDDKFVMIRLNTRAVLSLDPELAACIFVNEIDSET